MMWLLLLLTGCIKPSAAPLFPIPSLGPTAPARKRVAKQDAAEQRIRACVADCLKRDMARAVPWEIVVADCEASCASDPSRHDR